MRRWLRVEKFPAKLLTQIPKLAGVSVVAEGPMTAQTVTTGNGTFTLKSLIPGNYILITSLDGYETAQSQPVTVAEGMEQSVTLSIARQSPAANTVLGPNLSIPAPWFTYTGDLRAFYFGRTNGNTCLTCTPKGSPDATAFNFGGQLHSQVNIPYSPWVVGATYFGAYPSRAEFNFDVQYFFNPVRSGPYKGLWIRQRYADRTQTFTPFDFKYSRTQLEYTF